MLAEAAGEVPVGALVVNNGKVIGRGRNRSRELNDPSAHAEVLALREASLAVGSHRLNGAELFVTLEPCAMCSGAIFHSRLARVVFGAPDPKTGTAGSVIDLFSQRQLNHHTAVSGGVLKDQCQQILRSFFVSARKRKRLEEMPLREDALRMSAQALPLCDDLPVKNSYLYTNEGYRIRYLDLTVVAPMHTVLCIHELGFWSFQVWTLMNRMARHGIRVIAPDLLGHGLSDRPKKMGWHSSSAHVSSLHELIKTLDMKPTHIVAIGNVQSVGEELGLLLGLKTTAVLAIVRDGHQTSSDPAETNRSRNLRRVCSLSKRQLNDLASLPDDVADAYMANFPDKGHAAVLDALTGPQFLSKFALNSHSLCPLVLDEDHFHFIERELSNP